MLLGTIATEKDYIEVYADPSLRCKTRYIIHCIFNGQPKDHVIEGLFTKRQLEHWREIVIEMCDN